MPEAENNRVTVGADGRSVDGRGGEGELIQERRWSREPGRWLWMKKFEPVFLGHMS